MPAPLPQRQSTDGPSVSTRTLSSRSQWCLTQLAAHPLVGAIVNRLLLSPWLITRDPRASASLPCAALQPQPSVIRSAWPSQHQHVCARQHDARELHRHIQHARGEHHSAAGDAGGEPRQDWRSDDGGGGHGGLQQRAADMQPDASRKLNEQCLVCALSITDLTMALNSMWLLSQEHRTQCELELDDAAELLAVA